MNSVSSIIDQFKDSLYALTSCFCPTDSTLKLNGRTFKILRLLGEGGFSYVYLAQDTVSSRLFALKKIRCPLGAESVRAALKEVEAYRRFRHPHIIRCLDSCVVQDAEAGGGKIIYLFLPYYKNGTVQGIIAANAVNGTRYPEKEMLSIFLGTCDAVAAMHHYETGPSTSYPPPSPDPSSTSTSPVLTSSSKRVRRNEEHKEDEEEDEDDETRLTRGGEGEALIGSLEGAKAELEEEEGHRATTESHAPSLSTHTNERMAQPWAHRDIKPANIMIADDGVTPILMDFGSALPGRISIPSRSVALTQQDIAAEHCSMPFRAPELFDVKTGIDLTEALDIWSLGCTLYAMAYGTSPFETLQQLEHGGSIAMAVLNGKYVFPTADEGHYSEGLKQLIQGCLKLKPEERLTIDEVIQLTRQVLAKLS